MKKLFLAVLAMVLLASPVLAGTKTLSFFWSQPDNPTDLAGGKIYQSPSAGGPYVLLDTVPFASTQTEYTFSKQMTFPDGSVTTVYFVIEAFDVANNVSPKSNEPKVMIDFESHGAPVIRIIMIVGP